MSESSGPGSEPTTESIRAELKRILATPKFRASKHLTLFLTFIVDETLSGRANYICQHSIARNALERGPEFDPRKDCIVRVVAGKLRRALERFYVGDNSGNQVKIDLPKGTYQPTFRLASPKRESPFSQNKTTSEIPPASEGCEIGCPVVAVLPFVVLCKDEQARFLADSLTQDLCIRLSQHQWIQVLDYQSIQFRRNHFSFPGDLARSIHAD